MTIHKRTGAVTLGLVAIVLMGQFPLVAQEPGQAKTAPPAQKKQTARVPNYFGQIGLTAQQKAKIYGIVDKRQEKIDALEKQIAAERAELMIECESVLNETQKKLLDNLRKAAAELKPVVSSKPAEAPKPAEATKGSN